MQPPKPTQGNTQPTENPIKNKWYDKKSFVIILLFVFFPIGLYGLWKGSSFGKIGKIVMTSILGILLLTAIGGNETPRPNSNQVAEEINKSNLKKATETENVIQNDDKQDEADKKILAKVKEKIKQDYPNDFITQKGVYEMQVDAYGYMKSVSDIKIKNKTMLDYPLDFVTQKGVHEMQVAAKAYMETVGDQRIKKKVIRDYPNDYVTQKGVYEMQIQAKGQME